MKKLFVIAFMLTLATSAFAQPGKVSADYSGVIDGYNAATKTLTIKNGDKQGDFVITDTSEITQGKAKADVAALVAGHKVEVEFVMDGAKKLVQKAKVSGAATKK